MVLYFIGVYIINRTLHGRLEVRNFSSRVENSSTLGENFVSLRGHVISSIYIESECSLSLYPYLVCPETRKGYVLIEPKKLWNCTYFRGPIDAWLCQLDIYRSNRHL